MRDPTLTDRCSAQFRRLAQPAECAGLQSDVELLELYVRAQDRMAMETLVKRYAPLVASVCSLTVGDHAMAEDAFQATFLVFLRQAKNIRRRASLAAWLHGVAYRCACRLRKQKRERSIKECSSDATQQPAAPDPWTELARKMNLEALDRELEGLSEHLRGPLVEHYLLGFTAPQIADRMELSVSAVEGRLRRGRRVLRARLASRGISLSVLAAGCGLFQEHLAAAEASSWTMRYLDTYLPAGDSSTGPETSPTLTSSQVSSLVRGETMMVGTFAIKAALAAGILLAGGTLVALNAGAGNPAGANSTGEDRLLTLPAVPVEHSVVAQFVAEPTAPRPAAPPAVTEAEPARNSAMDQPVTWQRPESAEGAEPSWLAGGRSSLEAIEENRQVLSVKLDFKFDNAPLTEVVQWLSEQTEARFYLNTTEIELGGLTDPDTPVTLAGSASVREIIRLIGDPLELSYIVQESGIEITTKDHAGEEPRLRYYDLAYILPNSANVGPLVRTIYNSVTPLDWDVNGGQSTISVIGSMMVVSAPDTAHQKIEMVLVNIAKMNPQNIERATDIGFGSPAFPGGMGGGGLGGGMGGGMF